jgi:hypothetical protein
MKCSRCGAAASGLVCAYCGALTGTPGGGDFERQALEEFCGLLQGKDWKEQAKLLESGYIPSSPGGLIEAGVRCVPFIKGERFERPAEAAVRRLEAIVLKLKLLPRSDENQRAVSEFEGVVAEFRKAEASDTFWGLTVFGVLGLLLIVVAWILARKACG